MDQIYTISREAETNVKRQAFVGTSGEEEFEVEVPGTGVSTRNITGEVTLLDKTTIRLGITVRPSGYPS